MPTGMILSTNDSRLATELPTLLRAEGVRCVALRAQGELWEELRRGAYDLVAVDRQRLGPGAADEVRAIQAVPEGPEVVVLLGAEESSARAEFLALGALAVLSRQTPVAELSNVLSALALRASITHRKADLASGPAAEPSLSDIETQSPRMRAFLDVARRVANSDSSLLIQGETGSGKEFLAKAIHSTSLRRDGPFVPVHCAALSETLLESELFGHVQGAFTGATRYRRGYFELGHGGTVFLDEIGELSPPLQVKILRVLQERRVQPVGAEEGIDIDVRLMAATNRNLEAEMQGGRFRDDLYYRLSVVTLEMPPLRERREDIPGLVKNLQLDSIEARRRGVHSISAAALAAMCAYGWPGNVRELMNVFERAVLLTRGEEIVVADLPFGSAESPELIDHELVPWRTDLQAPFRLAKERVLSAFEIAYLKQLLTDAGGRLEVAAQRAELNPRSLYELMRRHELRKEEFREVP